jgi:hypothetical protein
MKRMQCPLRQAARANQCDIILEKLCSIFIFANFLVFQVETQSCEKPPGQLLFDSPLGADDRPQGENSCEKNWSLAQRSSQLPAS